MPTEIRMPRLVDTMSEGTVVAWRVAEGARVAAGDVIAEIEVDKTTVDLKAPEAGTLTRIVAPAGSAEVEVGALLAVLDETSEPSVLLEEVAVSPPTRHETEVNGHPEPQARRVPMSAPLRPEVDASPLARSTASQAGLDLASLRGSGPSGRIVQSDVLTALGVDTEPTARRTARPFAAITPEPPQSFTSYDDIPHSRVRQVIARRLGESKRTIPHFYLEVSCRLDALLALRFGLPADGADGPKPSINDFAVCAAALALKAVPEANASWTDAATRRYRRIDLAIAVATDAGLVAPVVRDADRKGLHELAAELRDLARRARDGRLRPEELEGGTFTVSNLGMYGVDSLYAIVNPPQAGILGLGAAGPRPVVVEGSIVVATMINCTLSADHRVLDGATGARFLAIFKSLIEEPSTMIGLPAADGQEAS
jgi:pyruvate dehydrogenase E2 component (dihydrolipoamide acetyltransferase)